MFFSIRPLICAVLLTASTAWCEQPAEPQAATPYKTPLAGESFSVSLLGEQITVPKRDRTSNLSLTVGVSQFAPKIGDDNFLPIAALYWQKEFKPYRSRLVFSIFANEWELARELDNRWELLGRLENYTPPTAQKEIVDGRTVTQSSLIWGTAALWLGLGYNQPVAPFQFDNNLRLQLFYTGEYLYSQRTPESGQNVRLPPNSWISGIHLRVRYDALQRNIMELPHEGFAGGSDLSWSYRHHWSDANYGEALFLKADTRQYTKISAYALAALPIPGLSDRDRLIASIYGGTTPGHDLDRFSAFRIGGGPPPCESDDLGRTLYQGALFNQLPVTDYAIANLEYRHELLFFLYLHLRGTLAWINSDILTTDRNRRVLNRAEAFSIGLTSGLPWNSTLYAEYSHDTGMLRNGAPGDSLLILWSKKF